MPLLTASKRLVRWLAYVSGSSARTAQATESRRIIMLHGVGGPSYPAEVLDEQLAWLSSNFEMISLEELVRRQTEQLAPTGAEISLTFDDGLRNNATIVAPMLAKHDVPATFFVCPGLIEDEAWLWNCEARERLASLRPAALDEVALTLQVPIEDAPSPSDAIEEIVAWMKGLDFEERHEASASIREATPVFTPTDEQRLENDMMSWDELLALDPERIAIGSHTVDHPILTSLDDDDLEYELKASREMLEKRLGRPVPHFCYPNGSEDERVRRLTEQHYDAAVGTTPGMVVRTSDPYRLPRIGATPSPAELAWRLHRP